MQPPARGAHVARLGALRPAVRAARRPPGGARLGRIRPRRVPRSVRASPRRQRVSRPDDGAAPGGHGPRPPGQPEVDRLRRRPDVCRKPAQGDWGVRPDLRPDLRAGRVTDDHHRAAPRRPRIRRRRHPGIGRLCAVRDGRRGAARRRRPGARRRDRRDRLPRRRGHVRLLAQPRCHPRHAQRGLAVHRRHGLVRRARFPHAARSVEGRRHQRRQQHLPARGRGGPARAPRGRGGVRGRHPRRRVGRGGGRIRRRHRRSRRPRGARRAPAGAHRPVQTSQALRIRRRATKNSYGKVLKRELRARLAPPRECHETSGRSQ